jgi:3-methyladenine DNA glycosylase/8-oxoguanine DNA glycosylase
MAQAGDTFYKKIAGAGYRGAYLRALAASVERGEVDLEGLAGADSRRLSDDEVDDRLQALPGVGPYASAHIMLMLGRYTRLILDSWTRPTYSRLTSGRAVKDATIERRFRRYGRYAGLAFWLFLTRDWLTDDAAEVAAAAAVVEDGGA